MNEVNKYTNWLDKNAAELWAWLEVNIFVTASLVQLGAVVAVFFLAKILSQKTAAALNSRLQERESRRTLIHISYREIFFIIYLVIGLWVVTMIGEGGEQPVKVLNLIANLATAWALIRLTSGIIGSRFWSRIMAITLWTFAALNIIGWLDGAVKALDEAAFTLGDFRLSALLVLKSLLAFVVLFWVVRVVSRLLDRSLSGASGLTPSQKVLFQKISTIGLYTISALVGLNIVGLDLTALAAFSGALGLGIGFGLQKVFGNLISGIILLLDKSVKPGDVIAIGDTYGWVNKLGGRCVSVLTRDGKEHLIPNENLITNEVENWSYSDQRIRLHIPVGVSYNSDMHRVKELLLEAVGASPRILKNPEPKCLMHGFGDSSVDFELRAWIDDPQQGIANVKSEILYRIWDLFKENDIEIPFPQRDVNLRNLPEEMLAALQPPQKKTSKK